jgi:hypothetical protein
LGCIAADENFQTRTARPEGRRAREMTE